MTSLRLVPGALRTAFLVALVLLLPLRAGAAPTDPGGWQRAKWGMSDTTLRLLYPQIQSLPRTAAYSVRLEFTSSPVQADYVVSGIKVLGNEFEALFFLTASQLYAVALRPTPAVNTLAFRQALVDELEGVYGVPSAGNKTWSGTFESVYWSFRTTRIVYHYWPAYGDRTAFVVYSSAQPLRTPPKPYVPRTNPNL